MAGVLGVAGCLPVGGTPEPVPAEGCGVDACAAAQLSEAAALACCVDTWGTGLTGDALKTLQARCQGDACDPTLYLSEAAAVCAAQVCGLGPGVGSCYASFETDGVTASWVVYNQREICAEGANLCGGGSFLSVDARTGACGAGGSWSG